MMNDDESDDDDDGWKILQPDVILFQTTVGSLEKPIPHPILDNQSKMMRVIANPLYDKLTLSRAAQIRPHKLSEFIRPSTSLCRSRERSAIIPSKSTDIDETTTMPLPNPSEPNNSRPISKSSSNRQISTTPRLPTASTSVQKSSEKRPLSRQSRAATARTTTTTTQSTLTDQSSSHQKPLVDGTIRYVNSRHGFEVQRYSSSNWLSIDVFTKDACQAQEKTFREMLDKKRQLERLSRSIYSSDYYHKRYRKLLESYKQGYLTHEQWAQQNYQLLCVKTLYTQAKNREQRDVNLDAQDVRRNRARSAYEQWKDNKSTNNSKTPRSRITTARSQHTLIDGSPSFVFNNESFSIPLLNTTDENNTTIVDTSLHVSSTLPIENEIQITPIQQESQPSKMSTIIDNASYMLDEKRWSLQAMLKRVVGLEEPLPPPPKIIQRKQSPMTNVSNDSGFESVR